MATKQRCPKCNQLNDLSARRCVRCGAPLIQVCPICGTPRPWYVGHCPNCEGQSTNDVLLADLFRETPHQELAHRYRLLSTLSKGPISTVYKAADLHSEKLYAIKELSPLALITSKERREAVATFERSLTLWRKVNHPGFVRIVDAFTSTTITTSSMNFSKDGRLPRLLPIPLGKHLLLSPVPGEYN